MSEYDPYVQRFFERGEQRMIAELVTKGWTPDQILNWRRGYWLGVSASQVFNPDVPAGVLSQ